MERSIREESYDMLALRRTTATEVGDKVVVSVRSFDHPSQSSMVALTGSLL